MSCRSFAGLRRPQAPIGRVLGHLDTTPVSRRPASLATRRLESASTRRDRQDTVYVRPDVPGTTGWISRPAQLAFQPKATVSAVFGGVTRTLLCGRHALALVGSYDSASASAD